MAVNLARLEQAAGRFHTYAEKMQQADPDVVRTHNTDTLLGFLQTNSFRVKVLSTNQELTVHSNQIKRISFTDTRPPDLGP